MHEALKRRKIGDLWATVNDAHSKWDEGDVGDDATLEALGAAVVEFREPETREARTEKCAKQVEGAMSDALGEWFPECESGDVDPAMVLALHVALRDFVKRWNEINQPPQVASVDPDAWRDADVNCPGCDTDEEPETVTLYGGRLTQLRCINCGHTQEAE